MLQKLSIENYVLIQKLEVDFSHGFSVITGETGSGKSIFLGALGLILGQRADTNVLLDKSRKCIVEGLFFIRGYNLEYFFKDHELDFDETIILRREINQTGKSRAFINDTPVNLSTLKDLGDKLVNIHSQHSIVTLNDADFQLAVLDNYAGIQPILQTYRSNYFLLVRLKKKKDDLILKNTKAKEDRDYYHFLVDELKKADLKPDELGSSEERLQFLTHAEEIKTTLFRATGSISTGEITIIGQLSDVINLLNGISRYNTKLQELVERLKINSIDIKDISSELSFIEEHIDIDQDEIEKLTQRLNLLYRLLQKHQKTTVNELIVLTQELEMKLMDADSIEEQITRFNTEIQNLEKSLYDQTREISSARAKVISNFEKEIIRLLLILGMNQAQFKIELSSGDSLSRDGIDKVRFLFSANKGIELDEVSRIASGGELSRLMLSIKSMISQKNLLPTIFFDEIDNGVSGEIAGKVGSILKQIGNRMQVIAITHLPQIAAKCNHHYRIYKKENQDIAMSYIKQLSKEERIEEIAKMLSDNTVTTTALKNAKELLNN
ncbi:MAG: DNA repair protein RecN [Bacteroidales bacterium]|jgi:DNA repair protein RecN (Recombination protein N)|nr:DNA repair protein RecN [Bacteroidales bacterium]